MLAQCIGTACSFTQKKSPHPVPTSIVKLLSYGLCQKEVTVQRGGFGNVQFLTYKKFLTFFLNYFTSLVSDYINGRT